MVESNHDWRRGERGHRGKSGGLRLESPVFRQITKVNSVEGRARSGAAEEGAAGLPNGRIARTVARWLGGRGLTESWWKMYARTTSKCRANGCVALTGIGRSIANAEWPVGLRQSGVPKGRGWVGGALDTHVWP